MLVASDLPTHQPQPGRLHYLDNLKAVMIILVIFHHAGQAYGPSGGWPVQDSPKSSLLGPYFWLQASFFMGLMFFLSASPRGVSRSEFRSVWSLSSKAP
jgi:peptidoglycan/LPS O-acetylase OafA/YrhL